MDSQRTEKESITNLSPINRLLDKENETKNKEKRHSQQLESNSQN